MKTRLFTRLISALFATALTTGTVFSDTVYITARPAGNPSSAGPNADGTYSELIAGSDVGAASSAIGSPSRSGARYFFGNTFSNSQYTGEAFLRLSPTLGVAGGTYQIHYTHSSTANNTTHDAVTGFSNAANCTLSFTETDKFQRRFGQPAPQQWQFIGYLTNDPGGTTPLIDLYLKSSTNTSSSTARFIVDCFRFTFDEPCLYVPTVSVTGPLSSNNPTVVVTGVSNAASKITVYQNSGSGMVQIGSKSSDIVGGANNVTVIGLVKGARVAATQTVEGQEGCVPTAGTLVGGGANPRIRMVLSVRETPSTGPAGAAGATTDADIHFLGATTRISGAPGDGPVIYPSNEWQTVTFEAGWKSIGNSTNVSSTVTAEAAYGPTDSISIRVFAFRTLTENGTTLYSPVGAPSAVVTSNGVFAVNWSWDAVPEAEGYRLIRTNHISTAVDAADITGTNFFADLNNSWLAPATVIPTNSQIGPSPSVKWNAATGSSAAGTQNDLATRWGILEAIAFAIDDLEDTGPYDLYIDNLQNGSTNWQTFEAATAGTTDFAFRSPSFSGTTSGNILPAPNQAVISNGAADAGTKSLRVRFQWNDITASKWLRLTTSGVGNPQINFELPTSLRILLLPVGATPVAPPAPSLFIARLGADTVLNWTGAHNLQATSEVTGTYTNVPNVTLAPYTNSFTETQKFFRLAN